MTSLSPGDSFGEFRIASLLGEGAMGQVYRAQDGEGREVALKVLREQLGADAAFRKRFEREAEVAMRVEHRHVVETLGSGEAEGRLYLTQEFVDGGSLAEHLDSKRGPIGPDETVTLTLQIAAGLDALHDAGLIHRDLKPANILLDSSEGAVVSDFGLAKDHSASSVLTQLGQTIGSISYMAPEQIRNPAEVDRRADVYALGCVVYECLCGCTPFAAHRGMRIAWAHMQEPHPDPREHRPELSERLAWAMGTALEKEPAKRPPTATAFARMLQLALRTPAEETSNEQ